MPYSPAPKELESLIQELNHFAEPSSSSPAQGDRAPHCFAPTIPDLESLSPTKKDHSKKKYFKFPQYFSLAIFISFFIGAVFGNMWGKKQLQTFSYHSMLKKFDELLINPSSDQESELLQLLPPSSEEDLLSPKHST